MSNFIHEAGWGIWPVLLFGAVSLAIAISHAAAPKGDRLALGIGALVATLLAGFLGLFTGLQSTSRAVQAIGESELFFIGMRESLNCVVAAFVLGTVSTLLLTAGSFRTMRVTRKASALSTARG